MLKQTLLAFSILAVAGTAAAADITNPFYLPQKGQVGSITTVGYDRNVIKNDVVFSKSHALKATEEIQYGLLNRLALIGSVGNTWDKWKGNTTVGNVTVSEKDNENIAWSAGLAWNILKGPARWQVSAKYGQDRLENFDGEYKYAAAETKFGYQFKKVLPYVSGGIEIPVGQKAGVMNILGYGDKFTYNVKAGVYQGACEVWALDTGVRLTYDENNEARVVTAEAEASYYITKNMTIGVYGTYALDGRANFGTDIYDKTIGGRLRLFF